MPGPVGRADRAGVSAACRSTGSASRASCRARRGSGRGAWPASPTRSAPWSSSRRRTAPRRPWRRWPRRSAPTGPRRVCRELTKTHEEVRRGTARPSCVGWAEEGVRGEVTIVVGGATPGAVVALDAARCGPRSPTGGGRRAAQGRDPRGGRAGRRAQAAGVRRGPRHRPDEYLDERAHAQPRRRRPHGATGSDRRCPSRCRTRSSTTTATSTSPTASGSTPAEALARAAAVGVRRIVQIGCDLPGAQWAVDAAAATHPALVAGVALHPNEAPRLAAEGRLEEALAEIERAGPAHATGCGRSARPGSTTSAPARGGPMRPRSSRSARHIDLAKRLDKTLVIHDRDAHDDVLDVLDDEGAPERWVMHCFSGDAALRPRLPGPRRLPVASPARSPSRTPSRCATRWPIAPLDRVLVETDAPFLTPTPLPRPPQRVVPRAADGPGDGRGPGRRPDEPCARRSTPTPRRRSAAPGSPARSFLAGFGQRDAAHVVPRTPARSWAGLRPCVWSVDCWPGSGDFDRRRGRAR